MMSPGISAGVVTQRAGTSTLLPGTRLVFPPDHSLDSTNAGAPSLVPRARPLIPTIPTEEVGGRCVAIHSFVAEKAYDLSFKKGDELIIVNKSMIPNWWEAQHAVSLKKGFIPSSYVVKKVPDPFCTVCGVQHAGTPDHSFTYVDEYEDLLDQGFFIIIIPS